MDIENFPRIFLLCEVRIFWKWRKIRISVLQLPFKHRVLIVDFSIADGNHASR